ncbi:hypothetical protein GCM10010094_94030 [Streptomyces flaveus]|uniref:Uncharacterized protein n=1 Tax=Streptomyces flaveus TaxID=66370 RepID=A0A917VVE6_9ACTN|nr:hypothetical protein GCM10010094_94030 [Streptomyces flaveus]
MALLAVTMCGDIPGRLGVVVCRGAGGGAALPVAGVVGRSDVRAGPGGGPTGCGSSFRGGALDARAKPAVGDRHADERLFGG